MRAYVTVVLALGGVVPGCWRRQAPACQPLRPGVDIVTAVSPHAWPGAPHFKELWRVGGLNAGQELAFPAGAAVSGTGRLAIPDFQLGEVSVVGADGTWLGAWATRGRGPGEVEAPVAAAWAGDDVVVFDIGGAKVAVVSASGSEGGTSVAPAFTAPVVSSGEVLWAGVAPDRGALLAVDGVERQPGLLERLVLRLAPGATAPDTLARGVVHTVPDGPARGFPLPGWPRPVAAVGPEGRVAVAATDGSYAVVVLDSADAPLFQLCRDALPVSVTAAERGGKLDIPPLADALAGAPRPDTVAAIGRIVLGAGGRLWVQRDRPAPTGMEALYGVPGAEHDVFDAQGRYLGSVQLPTGARLEAALGDTVWTFVRGDMDETWVVAYRLAWDTG